MNEYRSVYVVPENLRLAVRLRLLYAGCINRDDPLHTFLHPVDQRGDAATWGGPHLTLLDALTYNDTNQFFSEIQKACSDFEPPEIKPTKLTILGKSSLVLRCECPALELLKSKLIMATRHLIDRVEVTDEEITRAYERIARYGHANREIFEQAVLYYRNAGSPCLPRSRYFRLGLLTRLVAELLRIKVDSKQKKAQSVDQDQAESNLLMKQTQLDHFLTYGEPPWYSLGGTLHLTLVSGLSCDQSIEYHRERLEESVLASFQSYRPHRLAVMGIDLASRTSAVRYFDWLTEHLVEETRHPWKAVDWIDFSQCSL